MRIAYLTAGAAGMYCGSCMHDNTLAAGLRTVGCDTTLIPTYTPIRTDETDASVDQVFFGGINIYLQQKIPFFRHVPRFLDRFLDSPWLIRRVTRKATSMDLRELGALTVSMLKGTDGYQRKEVARLCDWLEKDLRPDLVLFTNALIGGVIPELKRRLKVPIVVTLQGDDIFLESLPEPYRTQAIREIGRQVPSVSGYLTHSQYYADFMAEYLKLPRDLFSITPLGLDVQDFLGEPADVGSEQRPATIGYLARLAPEKGLEVLVDAFMELHRRAAVPGLRLRIAGWLGSTQKEFAETQFQRLRDAGLAEYFEYVGSPDRAGKVDFLRSVDLLCVPTVYREPKGLFALEALAMGLPVVLPRHGAFPELLADVGGGVLVPPGDVGALADALATLTLDPTRCRELGRQGREGVLARRNLLTIAASTKTALEEISARNRHRKQVS